YWVLENFNIVPGQSLHFDVVGLPLADPWQAWARALAGAMVLALVVLAVAVAVRRPRRSVPQPRAAGADAQRQLRARRERLYAELVALERARLQQRVDAAAFDAQRKAIMTKLVLVHREIEEIEGAPPKPGQARVS